MKLGWTILYVPDVAAAVAFYEAAFGLTRRFVHESGMFAEMETGETTLGFAADAMAGFNGVEVRPNRAGEVAAGFELCLVSDEPAAAFARAVAAGAVAAGAVAVKDVAPKPWGQLVGYVRDLNGCLVELCSPVLPVPPSITMG